MEEEEEVALEVEDALAPATDRVPIEEQGRGSSSSITGGEEASVELLTALGVEPAAAISSELPIPEEGEMLE